MSLSVQCLKNITPPHAVSYSPLIDFINAVVVRHIQLEGFEIWYAYSLIVMSLSAVH